MPFRALYGFILVSGDYDAYSSAGAGFIYGHLDELT